jgi:hypothetical protein
VPNYPIGDVRWKNGPAVAALESAVLHLDQLTSFIVISDNDSNDLNDGKFLTCYAYVPFVKIGDDVELQGALVEAKGFLGERYNEDGGLLYLNTRYYAPNLKPTQTADHAHGLARIL